MRNGKSRKYKNYGPTPQNEYTSANSGKTADATAASGVEQQADDTAYKQRLIKRQSQHPSGRRIIRGWSRPWKANGWRAESAALQDETSDMGRYSDYVWKRSRSL